MGGTDALLLHLQAARLPAPTLEHRFAAPRRWRFDLAWPDRKVALEIEGGVWTGGRHTRPQGFLGDMDKYNRAAVLGWRIVRCTPSQARSGAVLAVLAEILEGN